MDLYCYKRKFIGNLALTEIAPCYPNEAMPPILILIRRIPNQHERLRLVEPSVGVRHSSNEYNQLTILKSEILISQYQYMYCNTNLIKCQELFSNFLTQNHQKLFLISQCQYMYCNTVLFKCQAFF